MARVLLVDFEVVPSPGRRSVELVNIVKALAPRYEVDVLTLKSPDLAHVDRFMRARMLRVPVGGDPLPTQVEAFRRAVRRQLEGVDYDVIHFRSAWAGLPACVGRRAQVDQLDVQRGEPGPGDEAGAGGQASPGGGDAGARLVFEPALSPLTEPRAADAELARTLLDDEEICLRAADRIIVPTDIARAHLGARGFGERLVLIRPGVDVDRFDWEPVEPPARPQVLYAGTLAGGRGLRLLLEAMVMVRARCDAELVLVGATDGLFAPVLDRAIRAAGLEAHVVRLGAVDHDEMPRVLSAASVCVAPSVPDVERPLSPFPRKILEYMACRRAVVVARRPVIEEVIGHERDGLLFEPGSAPSLGAAILRLLEDRDLRERLAEAAYRQARAAFTASRVRRNMLELYAGLAPPTVEVGRSTVTPAPDLPVSPETTTARHVRDPGDV